MAIHKCNIPTSPRDVISKAVPCFLIFFLAVGVAHGKIVQLTLYPMETTEPANTFRLLPDTDEQTDDDAVPLYEEAIQSMPEGIDYKQIRAWLDLPVEEFPQEKAEAIIQKHIESLRLAVKATRCKHCTWPEWKPGTEIPNLSVYRELTWVIQLWARLEMCRGRYEDALVAMQTAFGMTKQLGQAPTIIQTLVGAAVGGVMCREIEQFVQRKDSPNLYKALVDLPAPLVNVEKAIESERANLKDYNILTRKMMEKQLDPAYDRTRLIAKRLDNHLNALQIVEAIRHYAATHDGQLPRTLSDIKDMDVPNDLVSDKAFEYSRTTAGAILKSSIPKGGNERDAVHYEIVLKK